MSNNINLTIIIVLLSILLAFYFILFNITEMKNITKMLANLQKQDSSVIVKTGEESKEDPPLRDNRDFRREINISTRGEVIGYQQLGILTSIDEGDKKIIPLMGKKLYQSSDRWQYFTQTDDFHTIKIPLTYQGRNCMDVHNGCRELFDGDQVTIPELERTFEVKLYEFNLPRYIPNIY